MSKGRLSNRLRKEKNKKSIALSVRFPPEELEILNQIEEKTGFGYDALIRMLVKRLLVFWARTGKIEGPLFIATKEQAIRLGIIPGDDDDDGPGKVTGKIRWLSGPKKKKKKR